MKYKSSIKQMIQKYSLAPSVSYFYTTKGGKLAKVLLAFYPTQEYYNKKSKEFTNSLSPTELEKIIRFNVK
jgi:hypothetical protein